MNHVEKSRKWYLIATSICITWIIISVLVGAVLFGVVIVIFCGVFILFETVSNQIVHVLVSSEGVKLEGKDIPFHKIKSFSIIETPDFPNILRLNTSLHTLGSIDIYITPDISQEELRTFLVKYISENPHDELSTIEQLLIRLGL